VAEDGELIPQEPFGGLERRDFEEVITALREWAGSHRRVEEPILFEMGRSYSPIQFGVWQRFTTNRAISPQVIQAERVINHLFCAAGLRRRSLDHRS
jgi:hypothetical protein